MSEGLWYLKRCELFERLSAEQLGRLESHCRSRTFAAHTAIRLPAEKAESVFLLATGLAKVSHLIGDGKESILAFVEPGELFGELAILDGQQQDEFFEAVEASTVVMIPTEEMHRLIAERTDVALAVTKIIGLRRRRVERRLKNLFFLSIRERLIHLLLDLAEQFGRQVEEGVRIRLKLSHQDLANLIGATRETVTATLGRLKLEGSIHNTRCNIVLTNSAHLARSVHRKLPRETINEYARPRLASALAVG